MSENTAPVCPNCSLASAMQKTGEDSWECLNCGERIGPDDDTDEYDYTTPDGNGEEDE